MQGEGGRARRLGALLVCYHDEDGLRFAGRVGTGFDDAELRRLGRLLEERARETSPFVGRQPPKGSRWVEPDLVASVEYAEWTAARTLRAPSYKGLRDDLDARDATFPGEEADA